MEGYGSEPLSDQADTQRCIWYYKNLYRDAFLYNEIGSEDDKCETFAENIRQSPYYIPELDLAAVTNDGLTYLGYTGCMTCGNRSFYETKMGFSDCRKLAIGIDESTEDPKSCVLAIELAPGGFENTDKIFLLFVL